MRSPRRGPAQRDGKSPGERGGGRGRRGVAAPWDVSLWQEEEPRDRRRWREHDSLTVLSASELSALTRRCRDGELYVRLNVTEENSTYVKHSSRCSWGWWGGLERETLLQMHVGDIESVYDSRTDGPAAGVDGLRLPSVSTVTAPRGRVKARGGRDVRSHVVLMTLTAAPSQTPGRHDRGQRGENSGAGRAKREKGRLTDGVRSP